MLLCPNRSWMTGFDPTHPVAGRLSCRAFRMKRSNRRPCPAVTPFSPLDLALGGATTLVPLGKQPRRHLDVGLNLMLHGLFRFRASSCR